MSPNTKSLVVARKTLRDFSSLKLLLAFFVPYSVVTWIVSQGMVGTTDEAVGKLPLGTQEQILVQAFSQLSFAWAAGLPAMVLVAVLAANGIAKDEQRGTLRILLSKPVSRRSVLLGKFAAVVVFGFLAAAASLLVAGVTLYSASGASASALGGSIFALLPGNLVYALFVTLLVSAVGTFFAVATASRLKTALGTILIPAVFFAFLFVRAITGGSGLYETYRLYLVDVNYHLGNSFVLVHEGLGAEFSPLTQAALWITTGVYDASGWGHDPLVGGFSGTVPVVGHVPAAASVAVVVILSGGLLTAAIRRFDSRDIS